MTVAVPNPASLRVEARQRTYSNSTEEREAIDSTDRAVFDRVQAYEQALVEQTRAARTSAQLHEDAAVEIASALRNEVIRALDRPATEVDLEAVALRYKKLRAMGEQAISALNRAAADEEYRRPKLAAPYEDAVALWDKWPIVRPII
jgi:hypothetical protein